MFCPKCGTQNPETGKFCRSCGTDLGNISTALSGGLKQQPNFYVDKKGRVKSNDPSDIFSSGIRDTIVGIGFIIAAIALFVTNIWGGHAWWWAMLFPAFGSLAKGISEIVRYGMVKGNKDAMNQLPNSSPNVLPQPPANSSLPPLQTEYVKPQKSIYDTGELSIQPSVTEDTTRHLEINKEGETMTLPKK